MQLTPLFTFLAAFLMALPTCEQGSDEKPLPHAEGKTVEEKTGYTITIKPDKDNYQVGEKVNLIIIFKNVAKTDGNFISTSPFNGFTIDLSLPEGKPAPQTEYGKLVLPAWGGRSRSSRKMKPGEEVITKVHLNRFFDMTLSGEYKIKVSCQKKARDGSDNSYRLESNFLSIKILAEGEKPEKKKPSPKIITPLGT
jgi:hypothetical protein